MGEKKSQIVGRMHTKRIGHMHVALFNIKNKIQRENKI